MLQKPLWITCSLIVLKTFVKQGYVSVIDGVEPPAGVPDMADFKVLMPDFGIHCCKPLTT